MTTRLILVGGFLGAGKTTLLWEAASRLAARGLRCGLITNDQAPELVDTAFLARRGVKVAEVAGSCFCCNFEGLLGAIAAAGGGLDADVLLAEPVGSCADLSATIVQPLKESFRGELAVGPLTVLIDPARLDDTAGGLHPSAAYIFRKQIEEADIAVISKADRLDEAERERMLAWLAAGFPELTVHCLSAARGDGLDAWLDEVLHEGTAGRRILDIDYDVYAEGEAALGWLNASLALRGERVEWGAFGEDLLERLGRAFAERGAAIGHVKLMLEAGENYRMGSLTRAGQPATWRGPGVSGEEVTLTVNARVQMDPDELDRVVRASLARVQATELTWRCFSPARPKPTHRYDHVVTTEAQA